MEIEIKVSYYDKKDSKSLASIYKEKDKLTVLLPSKPLEDFQTFGDLKKELIKKSGGKNKIPKIDENESFILYMGEKMGDLDTIFNESSYEYFLKKVSLSNFTEDKLFFFIFKKVDELPKWRPPDYVEIFKYTIKDETEKANEYIKKSMTLLKLEEANKIFIEDKKKHKELLEKKDEHISIICSRCLKKSFQGQRYICTECLNYNLCSKCEAELMDKQFHNKDHTFILINKPIETELNEYKNVISPKNQEIYDPDKNFSVQIKVANSGAHDLKDCYFSAIKYGSTYLVCKKFVIENDFPKKTVNDFTLELQMPEDYENGVCFGYFRMFTKEGLPFGDVIRVSVFGGKNK